MSNEVDAVLIPVVVAEEAISDEDASDQDQEASEDSSSDGGASEAVAAYAGADEQDSSWDDSDDSFNLEGSDNEESDNDLEDDSGDFFVRAFDPDQTCDDDGKDLFDCDPDVSESFDSHPSDYVPKEFQSCSLENGSLFAYEEDCRVGSPCRLDGPPVCTFDEWDKCPENSVRSWAKSPTATQQRLGFKMPLGSSGFFNSPITIGPITVAPTHLLNVRGGDPKPHNPLVGLQLQLASRLKMRWYHASGSFLGKKVYRVPTVVVKGERVSVLPGCALQGPDTQVHSVRIQADLKGKAVLPAQKLSLVALKEVLGAYWIFATTSY